MREGWRAAQFLARLGRWQRRGVAVLAGACSVLAMAPFFLWPVLFVTLPVLVWLIDGAIAQAPRRKAAHAASAAWWFGFGYFLLGLFWIGEAFLVEAATFAVFMPFAVTIMPAGLALFWAGAAAVAAFVWVPDWRRVLMLALTLSGAEWLRGHVLTGFPWNVLGYALTGSDVLMQSASVLGIYGLSMLVIIVCGLPLVVWEHVRSGELGRPALVIAVIAVLAPLAAMAGWGALRLAGAPAEGAGGRLSAGEARIRIVQASIPQREKWQRENQRRIFERHLELSTKNAQGIEDGAKGIALVVWPEAAMPFLPLDIPEALAAIGRVVPAGGHLASGILRVEPAQTTGARRRVLNSLAVFGEGGRPVSVYDKIHLVPFGEYLPFQATLEAIGLEQLTRIRGGFDVGPSPRPLLRIPGLAALGPLICYEVIFPAAAVQGSERPRALLNVTNDGWFGNTTGPHQHFHQSRVRAVEEGLPIVRAANNGISAFIDGYGRINGKLSLNVVGTVDGLLPPRLAAPIYARFGDLLFFIPWLSILAYFGWSKWHGRGACST